MAQMMLNYDLTFLAILLTGLYEPETETEAHRCLPHPIRRHTMLRNESIDYAADMCMLLAWQKLRDDWKDERNPAGKAGAALLKKAYQRAVDTYPRQAAAVSENIHLLHKAEQEHLSFSECGLTADIDLQVLDFMAGFNGAYLAEIFDWKKDIWSEDLRTMGFYMGKFIYLMDALEDVQKDRKKENYNLFANCADVWETETELKIRAILVDMMSQASRAFERLPVIEYAEIIRNILYAGVWCRYTAVREKNREKTKKQEKQRISNSKSARENERVRENRK